MQDEKSRRHGCLIVCDIVAFSEKDEAEQVACVEFLHEAFEKAVVKLDLAEEPYVNCTGDGFLGVFSMTSPKHGSAIEASLQLCEEVLRACANYTDTKGPESEPLLVRFGVHKDDYPAKTNAFGAEHVIGSAPNLTSRITGVGDKSHLVVSRDFYSYAVKAHPDWGIRFSSEAQVSVKHNRLVSVRLYKGAAHARGLFNINTPRRVRIMETLDSRILQNLNALLAALVANLGLDERLLRPRLSIFLPDRDGTKLVCTSYRSQTDLRRTTAGTTEYPLSPPVGPLAHALTDRQPKIVNNLPDPLVDEAAYVDAWLQGRNSVWGLTRAHILGANGQDGWSRFPRALIAVPFQLPRNTNGSSRVERSGTAKMGTSPSAFDEPGVLCVDTEHPLGEDCVLPAKLTGIVRGIRERLEEEMAWLLLARRLA